MVNLKKILTYSAAFFTLFGLVACGSSNLAKERPIYEAPESSEEYQIGVGDNIRINVWKNPDLSVDVPVRPDGQISMPLVGDVIAAGQTAEGLSVRVAEALKAYIRSPQVTVIIANASSAEFQRRIRITGAINSQMSTPYRDGMTVLDIVLEAGGLSEFASANKAKLYRKVGSEVKVYPIRLDDILNKGKLETNYLLLPADIVTVPERVF